MNTSMQGRREPGISVKKYNNTNGQRVTRIVGEPILGCIAHSNM
jgi:hypothetical protein